MNRKDSPNDSTPWEPRERSVICSDHFVGGEPTPSNPYPTLKMGYNIVSLHGELSIRPPRLKLRAVNPLEKTLKKEKGDKISTSANSVPMVNTTDPTLLPEPMPQKSSSARDDGNSEVEIKPKIPNIEQDLELSQPPLADRHKELEKKIKILNGEKMALKMRLSSKLTIIKNLTRPTYQQLLKQDNDVNFYTGVPNLAAYHSICSYIRSFEKGRENKTVTYHIKVRYRNICPAKTNTMLIGDRILLTLMKLRLGLLHKDLADR
mgnify:CR=1 FL=1